MKRALLLWGLLAAVALSLWFWGCAEKPTPVAAPPEPPAGTPLASIAIAGNVNDVLNGTINDASFVELKPADLIAGLGAGTFGPKEQTGDLIILGDRAYVKVPDEAQGYPTVGNEMGLKAAYAVAIAKGERPAELINRPVEMPPIQLDELLKELVGKYRVPIAVYGIGEFLTVEGLAMKRAPIEGESILAESARPKYMLPRIQKSHEVMAFFGVAAAEATRPWSPAKELFERVLSIQLDEQPTGGVSFHVHGAILARLNEDPAMLDYGTFFAAARAASVQDAFHLLDSSTLRSGSVVVYALGKVAQPPTISVKVEGGVGLLMPVLR